MNGPMGLLLVCMLSVSCWNNIKGINGAAKAHQAPATNRSAELFAPEIPPPPFTPASYAPDRRDDDARAQYKLCLSLYQQNDILGAMTWCEKAAQQDFRDAQYVLGSLYLFSPQADAEIYKKAERWLLRAAERGHAAAQGNLGMIYYHGLSGTRDPAAAEKWLRAAADQDIDTAEYSLGNLYARGDDGIPQDFEKAALWFEKAAMQGGADAQHSLSALYMYGKGVAKDYGASFFWAKKAAESGHAEAQYNLGMMYYFGSGTETNDPEAIKWLNKAALAGVVDAQLQLGYMYFYREAIGEMDPEDSITMAYMYYSLAAQQQNAEAIHHVAEIKSYLDAQTFEKIETAAQGMMMSPRK